MPRRDVTLCAGVSGSGKSTFGIRYLVNDRSLATRFLFDPDPGEFDRNKGEFASRLKLPPARDLYELGLHLCRGWVCFDPHTLFPGRMEEAFAFFCDFAWETSARLPGRKILVVDEVWNYCSPHSIPIELSTIIQSGRKRGLKLMVNTQEPNRLNSSVLNGVSEWVSFKLQSPRALDLVGDYGFNPDEVSGLAPLQWISRNLDTGGELRGRIKV